MPQAWAVHPRYHLRNMATAYGGRGKGRSLHLGAARRVERLNFDGSDTMLQDFPH
jgi:hypothetical protein